MSETVNYKSDESYISALKRHYIAIIILPMLFVCNFILLSTLRVEHKYPNFNRFMLFIEIGLFIFFIFLPISYLFKRKCKKAFYFFLTPIVIMITTNNVLSSHGLDSDGIFFLLHKEEYLHIIESSPSIATDGGAKLVKIRIPYRWVACESYVVYDESDKISNPPSNFRVIHYVYFSDLQSNKYSNIEHYVTVKNYEKHIYIVNHCKNTGQ